MEDEFIYYTCLHEDITNPNEIANLRKGLQFIKKQYDDYGGAPPFLTMDFVKEVHRKVGGDGEFSRNQRYSINMETGQPMFFTEPEYIEAKLQALIDHTNILLTTKKDIIPWFLYEFIYIHPFGDYNGRTSRLLACFLNYGRPVSIRGERRAYINAIQCNSYAYVSELVQPCLAVE